MERLLKALIAGVVALGMLIAATWLFLRENQASPATATISQPTTPAPTSVGASAHDTSVDDPCHEAVVLTLQSHSGVSALMTVQNTEGQHLPTAPASEDEGKFAAACYRLPDDESSGDASPQFLKVCKPGTFVLHITGNGKGVFDLQGKPFPEVDHPGGPLLLCNYTLDNDRVYDWVLKYQGGKKPAVFLLGSKGDPNLKP